MADETTRPVWLDEHQRDDLTWVADYLRRHGFPEFGNALTKHAAQWDAAPADPVEAVRTEVEAAFGVSTWSDAVIFGALRALGWRAAS